MRLSLDFETHSLVDLKSCGLDVYARDPSTKVLMMAYQIDMEDGLAPGVVHCWEPHLGPMPPKIREMIENPKVQKCAFNAGFEIAMCTHVLGLKTTPADWWCTQVMSLSLGLPADLDQLLRAALQTDHKYWKDARGTALMRMFSFPKSTATWETHPAEWQEYVNYCKQDVVAEVKAFTIMRKYIPDMGKLFDRWALSEKINKRGLPVDIDFINSANRLAEISKAEYKTILKESTKLDNPNSTKQVLAWLTERGYPFASIAKNRVKIAMKDFEERIAQEAHEFIAVRLESNKTSLAKYNAIKRASWRGRLRSTFQYLGAAATGRYAGRILGQNMPRPWGEVEEWLPECRQMIAEENLDDIKFFFGKPLEVLSSSIRSAIATQPGKKLIVADYASIELCVIAWWTNCSFWQGVVESGQDAYKAFAVRWFGIPYEQVTKAMRKLSKPPALGCGYRMGAGRETGTYPDTEKTGLWGYSANMGVDMTKQQCKEAVNIYRELSPEIVQAWYDVENAALECVRTGEPQQAGMLSFDMRKPFLRMRLPSGRYIHYCRPKIEQVAIEYEVEDPETGELTVETQWKTGLTYERLSQASKKWVRRSQHGGRFAEQATQGIAYDLLQDGIENAEKAGYPVVGHYHDEILAEVDEDGPQTLEGLVAEMVKLKPWAHGMHVRAEGYEADFYRK